MVVLSTPIVSAVVRERVAADGSKANGAFILTTSHNPGGPNEVEETDTKDTEVGTLHYVLLLHAFCVVDPLLCAPASNPSQFVVTFQPYLKKQADSRVVAQLVESIVFVIDSVLTLVRKLPQSVIEDLEQDLKQIIVHHSFFTVVHACIKYSSIALTRYSFRKITILSLWYVC